MTVPDPDTRLQEQIGYYRARAPEYDDWWLRLGHYEPDDDVGRRWEAGKVELDAALDAYRGADWQPDCRVARQRRSRSCHCGRHRGPWLDRGVSVRTLADGRRFHIVKRAWRASDLEAQLTHIGWRCTIAEHQGLFIRGEAARRR